MMRQLSENLYLFEDTCNVYAVRAGESAVLIDFGSASRSAPSPASSASTA